MDRIVWGLCTALQRKDARFVNPFHYVQIMATLSRLPPYILSRAPRPRRQALQNLEALTTMGADEAARNTETVAAAAPAAEKQETSERRSMIVDGKTSHTAEEMWEYIIAKTCIFIPSLTSSQRCRACRGLRLAVLKRESALARSSRGDARRSASMSLAETLLLPMAHELSRYPKDYEAAMFSRAPDEKG
ncbi:hypothetical protein DQ04_01731030 [Trypanosoma grayi]|uniref:hypothetical protein n=1 Tax=Trypanosoma grayi TaxID=71804 RepID=UPI0004F41E6D|nr:hypothetical protein DQ04_01731030 [Trypanosoma grayi]KEG12415.1 hypothetical protein DQ04_01731030 [Trypanosoma grayi]